MLLISSWFLCMLSYLTLAFSNLILSHSLCFIQSQGILFIFCFFKVHKHVLSSVSMPCLSSFLSAISCISHLSWLSLHSYLAYLDLVSLSLLHQFCHHFMFLVLCDYPTAEVFTFHHSLWSFHPLKHTCISSYLLQAFCLLWSTRVNSFSQLNLPNLILFKYHFSSLALPCLI